MGTVVFPDAQLKIFLDASAEERARRRYKQLKDKDLGVSLRALLESIRERDERDRSRAASPLKPADDAVVIDSSSLSIDAVFEQVWQLASKRGLIAGSKKRTPRPSMKKQVRRENPDR
jgi:cytidylate kinase